jgi:hypothetical protein
MPSGGLWCSSQETTALALANFLGVKGMIDKSIGVALRLMSRFSLAAMVACAFTSSATAQAQTPVAEAPAPAAPRQTVLLSPFMEYQVTAREPNIPAAGTVFRPNQQVASFMIAPKVTAILKTATLRRPRAFPESLPAGTALFQVQVDNGFAYCAFWGPTQGVRQTQCFRDINNDGSFDASYITYSPLVGTSLYVGRIAGLAAMPPVAYEVQAEASGTPEPFSYRFLRVREGVAEFKPQFGADKRGFKIIKCNLRDGTPCGLGAADYVFQENAGGLTLTSVTPVDREFWLYAERNN